MLLCGTRDFDRTESNIDNLFADSDSEAQGRCAASKGPTRRTMRFDRPQFAHRRVRSAGPLCSVGGEVASCCDGPDHPSIIFLSGGDAIHDDDVVMREHRRCSIRSVVRRAPDLQLKKCRHRRALMLSSASRTRRNVLFLLAPWMRSDGNAPDAFAEIGSPPRIRLVDAALRKTSC